MHTHVVSQDSALDTGPYHLMDDLTSAHVTAGSKLVTHRVEQVTSKKTDNSPPATKVDVAADISA